MGVVEYTLRSLVIAWLKYLELLWRDHHVGPGDERALHVSMVPCDGSPDPLISSSSSTFYALHL